MVSGVIYAIIHIPSNKIYVGQTIQECYLRFKGHWHDRCNADWRNINLHRLMRKQRINNFVIWPLEVIDKALYYQNGTPNLIAFRRAATIRERFWIQRLQTMRPKGLNCRVPLGKQMTIRQPRQNRWLNTKEGTLARNIFTSCVNINSDGEISVHEHAGPDSHIRLTVNKLLYMAKHFTEENIKTDIGKMSHNHRIGLLRWLNENISNINITEHVILIERLLREFLMSRAESKTETQSDFFNFVKHCTL